jgi:hypothetical protein
VTAGLGMVGLAGGAVAARVAALHGVLLPVSVVSLACAYYLAYRRGPLPRWRHLALWMSTPVTVLSWLWPYLTR